MGWRSFFLLLVAGGMMTVPGGVPVSGAGALFLGFSPPADPIRETLPPGWQEFRFDSRPRPTVYRVVAADGRNVLLADARNGASILYTRITDPAGRRRLSWGWRVDRPPEAADLRHEESDDAGARVYVGFRYEPALVPRGQRLRYSLARVRYGETPPFAGLVYVWGVAPDAGTRFIHRDWPRLGVIVLHDENAPEGTWLRENRDVVEDYRTIFGSDPPPVSHVGVMTDADDTGGRAVARYRSIALE